MISKLKNFDARYNVLMCKSIVACAVVHNFIIVHETVDANDIDVDDDNTDGVQHFNHKASASGV